MRTDYLGVHERKFQRLRRDGATGYNSDQLYEDSLEKVLQALRRQGISNGRVLELGCAAGDLSILLAKRGYEAHGVDISPTAIAWAIEKAPDTGLETEFREGSVLSVPYANHTFDVVIDALCWHCIIGDDRPIFLENVHRVLRPGGIFIVMTKCGEPRDPEYPFDPKTRCRIDDGIATRYWGTPELLAGELEVGRFSIDEQTVHPANQDLFFCVAKPIPG